MKNRLLGLFIFSLVGWNSSILLLQITQNFFWAQTSFFSASFISLTLLLFAFVFPYSLKIKRIYKILLILPAGFFALIALFRPYLLYSEITFSNTSIIYKNQSLHPAFLGFFLGYFMAAIIILLYKYKQSKGIHLVQLKYFFWGLFVALFLIMLVSLILPSFGVYQYNGLGPPLTSLITIAIAYAIIRHQLMDIGLAIKKSTVYISSILATTLIAAGGAYILYNILSLNPVIAGPAILIFGLIIFSAIKPWFEVLGNKYLFVSTYNYQQSIKELTRDLIKTIDLDQISDSIIGTIRETMRLKKAKILLLETDDSQRHYKLIKNIGFDPNEKLIDQVINEHLKVYFNNFKKPLVYELIDDKIVDPKIQKNIEIINNLINLKNKLQNLPVAVYIPMIHHNELIGLILLGEKISKDSFSKEDLSLLETLANQAAISIANARLYSQVQNLNKNLQQRVDEQTRHLHELLEMKSEFLTIASHQLRTPTSIIKGMLSTLLDKTINLENDKKENFLQKAFQGSLRLEKIVSDLLKTSQLAAGKMETEAKPIDIGPIIEKLVSSRLPLAEEKKVNLKYNKPGEIPKVVADPIKIFEAIANLIDNALHYTDQGQVEIKFLDPDTDKNYLKLSIRDTGIGIPPEEIEIICEKFKRGQKSFQINPDGSGLGLYITKQILDANNSRLEIFSEGEDKGSTFNVYLPVFKERGSI